VFQKVFLHFCDLTTNMKTGWLVIINGFLKQIRLYCALGLLCVSNLSSVISFQVK